MSSMPSLFGILQKAQPRWSTNDVCKVTEKLQNINVTDVQSLGLAVMEGSLNTALVANGDRKLKESTLAQLRIQVRGPYRAAVRAQETVSTIATRRCFCGKCLLGASYRGPECEGPVDLSSLHRVAITSTGSRSTSALGNREDELSSGHARKAGAALVASPKPSAQSGRLVRSLQQAGGQVISGKSLRKVQSEPFFARIAESSNGEAGSDSSPSSKPRAGRVKLASLTSSASLPVKTRCGVLHLVAASVPGGMRHDDDALQGLLRAAESHLKRGFIKPSAASPMDATMIPIPETSVVRQGAYSSCQASDADVSAGPQKPTFLSAEEEHLYNIMQNDADMYGGALDGYYGVRGQQYDVPRTGSTDTRSFSSVHTVERADPYSTTNTALSGHVQARGQSAYSDDEQRRCDRDILEEDYSDDEEFSGDGSGAGGVSTARTSPMASREGAMLSQASAYSPLRSASSAQGKDAAAGGLRTPSQQSSTKIASRQRAGSSAKAGSVSDSNSSRYGDEATRESRRLRWINAYDSHALPGYSSSAGSAYTGYSVPTSSVYTATSGTSEMAKP